MCVYSRLTRIRIEAFLKITINNQASPLAILESCVGMSAARQRSHRPPALQRRRQGLHRR